MNKSWGGGVNIFQKKFFEDKIFRTPKVSLFVMGSRAPKGVEQTYAGFMVCSYTSFRDMIKPGGSPARDK